MSIDFYDPDGPNGWLANFSAHPIRIGNNTWQTVEHYYQSRKFTDKNIISEIRNCSTPALAKKTAKQLNRFKRNDWKKIKFLMMYNAVKAKFTQHKKLEEALIKTDQQLIREVTENDPVWGVLPDGTGLNHMGRLLMRLRDNLAKVL